MMDKKRIAKVTIERGWTTYFVESLYMNESERERVKKVIADFEPTLIASDGSEVCEVVEFDEWWDRAWMELWAQNKKPLCESINPIKHGIREMITNVLVGLDISKCTFVSEVNGTVTIEATYEPIEFNTDLVDCVLKANNGHFVDVQYKCNGMSLRRFKEVVDELAKDHPELLDNPIKVHERWDADEPDQLVARIGIANGEACINWTHFDSAIDGEGQEMTERQAEEHDVVAAICCRHCAMFDNGHCKMLGCRTHETDTCGKFTK